MDQDAQTDELYDFLYRDSGRIGSYYAQIFGGKLSSFEKAELEREVREKTGKANIQIAGFEGKLSKETQSSDKQTFDPHDLIASDVLAILTKAGRFQRDVRKASHGALVIVQGSVVFVDKGIMELAGKTIRMLVSQGERIKIHKSLNRKCLWKQPSA